MSAHTCHALGCAAEIPALFMCKRHWWMLPKTLRDGIWSTYRRGQEIDKLPSKHYVEAAREAIDYVARQEHKAVTPLVCQAIGCDAAPVADCPMCPKHWAAIPIALRDGLTASVLSDAAVLAVLKRFPGAMIVDIRGPRA